MGPSCELAQLKRPFSVRMKVSPASSHGEMASMRYSTSRCHKAPAKPQSFLEFFRFFFTAQLCKQIHQAFPAHALRWQPQPLIFVLLSMTWCCSDSQAERFET